MRLPCLKLPKQQRQKYKYASFVKLTTKEIKDIECAQKIARGKSQDTGAHMRFSI